LLTLRWSFNLPVTLSLVWLAIPLSAFLALGWAEGKGAYHSALPLAVISLIWLNDTFAYGIGSLIGRHQMTPLLSPGKTWEGFFGGMLASLAGAWLCWKLTASLGDLTWIIFGFLISTLGLAGDLFESGLKRSVKVKNSGKLLPGHGGILDRFDSLLFVSPVLILVIVLLRILT